MVVLFLEILKSVVVFRETHESYGIIENFSLKSNPGKFVLLKIIFYCHKSDSVLYPSWSLVGQRARAD